VWATCCTDEAFVWPIVGEHVTTSRRPEIHDVLQRRQRQIEPRSQATHAEYSATFGRRIPETCERIQTD